MNDAERRDRVRQTAKRYDPDRYLSALFAPASTRDDLFALYAFNAELARIPEEISEPMLGEIRLQWWRDALQLATSGKPTGHPVADAIGATLLRHDIGPSRLEPLITARRTDILERIMPDTASLHAFIDRTAGEIFAIGGAFLGGDLTATAHAAKPAGRAYGLTGLMRAVLYHARQDRLYLPVRNMPSGTARHILHGEMTPPVVKLLASMRDEARENFEEARQKIRHLPPKVQMAFQPLALVEPYLAALARHPNPLRATAEINPIYRLCRLMLWRP